MREWRISVEPLLALVNATPKCHYLQMQTKVIDKNIN